MDTEFRALVGALSKRYGPFEIETTSEKGERAGQLDAISVNHRVRSAYVTDDGILLVSGFKVLPKFYADKFRSHIAETTNAEILRAAFVDMQAVDQFVVNDSARDRLKDVPKPYAKNHPQADLLKLQRLFVSKRIGVEGKLDQTELQQQARDFWNNTMPLTDWVYEHLII